MAKDVQFNTKLQLDGKEQIVVASTNVRELAEQLGVVEALDGIGISSTQVQQDLQTTKAPMKEKPF